MDFFGFGKSIAERMYKRGKFNFRYIFKWHNKLCAIRLSFFLHSHQFWPTNTRITFRILNMNWKDFILVEFFYFHCDFFNSCAWFVLWIIISFWIQNNLSDLMIFWSLFCLIQGRNTVKTVKKKLNCNRYYRIESEV